jgi:hypothetical protein
MPIPQRLNRESSVGIYFLTSAEDRFRMRLQRALTSSVSDDLFPTKDARLYQPQDPRKKQDMLDPIFHWAWCDKWVGTGLRSLPARGLRGAYACSHSQTSGEPQLQHNHQTGLRFPNCLWIAEELGLVRVNARLPMDRCEVFPEAKGCPAKVAPNGGWRIFIREQHNERGRWRSSTT